LSIIVGYYCEEGLDPIGCPAGTYNNITGLSLETQCSHCSPGLYCEGIANIIPTGNCVCTFSHILVKDNFFC